MFRSYWKIALRNLWKNKGFSALNIIGLSTGLAVCLLIVLYVVDEWGYDRYNQKAARTYRVDADIYFNNTQFRAAVTPEPLGAALVREYPQIEAMTRLNYQGDILVKKGNENIQDHEAVYADSTFFKVFTVPLLAGNPENALEEPHSIVIDETTARKYFGHTDVVGKTLYVDNTTNCKITGVFRDIPRQSHFHFRFIRPLTDTWRGNAEYWLSNNIHTYVIAKEGVSQPQLQGYVNTVVNKYVGKQIADELKASLSDLAQQGNYFKYPLMRLTDIHLDSDLSFEFEANGNRSYVTIFSVVAVFILLVACINFMNLSTARSANRAKEVGIKKVLGSLRRQLVLQFLTESLLLSFLSLVLAIGLALLLLPLFNQLSGKTMLLRSLSGTWLIPFLLLLVFLVGCLAGSYPAFYLSAFKPILVLKGKLNAGFKRSYFRNSLVVLQFCISIVLIIGTLVIYQQLEFIRNRKIGYNRDQVLILQNTGPLGDNTKAFTESVRKLAGIEGVSSSADMPTAVGFDESAWFRDASFDAARAVITTNFYVDDRYIPTLGMEMVSGRNFSVDFPTDSFAVILNEAAVKLYGFKEPLKEMIYRPWGNEGKRTPFHVIGVVRDFNFSSMHTRVQPLAMQWSENRGRIAVRLKTTDIAGALRQIEEKWKSMAQGQPFQYTFMDADFEKTYHAEQRTGKLFMIFSILAIFIAALGLLGLATYAAEQRTREIGIRKVMGADIAGVVMLLSREFALLVLMASVIAFPLAWYAMHRWLENFAYRVEIRWWVFLQAGLFAFAIAILTVGFQGLKAALANPVNSLRAD
ncbi:ABC transporter permease [Flavihumibacter petaseus]|uniref:Putative ABC transporter permease protein n=1 Tax=Flavihumibacter petaseus NBRC 106054 TaxID=1220578 RepID=A0A0E9MXS7_9BACT|nr:ABC transporter permease [Flavihumibacter petaseus]GAO41925.1 putative ABC transporter permease protein [Flavihumibacter petaseus NBRC 106054]